MNGVTQRAFVVTQTAQLEVRTQNYNQKLSAKQRKQPTHEYLPPRTVTQSTTTCKEDDSAEMEIRFQPKRDALWRGSGGRLLMSREAEHQGGERRQQLRISSSPRRLLYAFLFPALRAVALTMEQTKEPSAADTEPPGEP